MPEPVTVTTPWVASRRTTLRTGAAVLLSAGLWPGALRAADADGGNEFRFFCVNDLHCQDKECGRWVASRVVARIVRLKGLFSGCSPRTSARSASRPASPAPLTDWKVV